MAIILCYKLYIESHNTIFDIFPPTKKISEWTPEEENQKDKKQNNITTTRSLTTHWLPASLLPTHDSPTLGLAREHPLHRHTKTHSPTRFPSTHTRRLRSLLIGTKWSTLPNIQHSTTTDEKQNRRDILWDLYVTHSEIPTSKRSQCFSRHLACYNLSTYTKLNRSKNTK